MHTSNLGRPRSVCLNPLLIGEHFPTGAYGFQTLEWIYVSIPFSSGNTFQLLLRCATRSAPTKSQSPSHRGTLSNEPAPSIRHELPKSLNPLLIGEAFRTLPHPRMRPSPLASLNPLLIGESLSNSRWPSERRKPKPSSLNPLLIGEHFPTKRSCGRTS